MTDYRFIEKDFPIEWLNPIALREGNSKRLVYRMHKWWARRLGSVFRAFIVSLLSGKDTAVETIRERFLDRWQATDAPIILDPFMGGGTTLFESLRLGARVIGSDINPVAWFLTKKEIEPVDITALQVAYDRLEGRVGAQIKAWFTTTCPAGHQAETMYFFWVKQIPCVACGEIFDLWPNYWVARWPKIWTVVCPRCGSFFEAPSGLEQAQCNTCGHVFNPAEGNSGRGLATCPHCRQQESHLGAVQRLGKPLPVRLFGVEGYCPICDRRFLKPADADDLQLAQQAAAFWEQKYPTALFPRQEIPTAGRSDPRPVNHGYTYFHQLFLPRQLLALTTLLEGILAEPDINLQEHLLLAFSDCLDANNLFCKYEIDYHKISLLFGLHAYHPIERPTENNVWGTRYGRGTFSAAFDKVLAGKRYAIFPFEREMQGGEKHSTHHPGVGALASTIKAFLDGEGRAYVHCGDSAHLDEIPAESIDAVVTDPPYFDNVMYSELADFFYVWLRISLQDRYPWFKPEHSKRGAELVQNEKEGKNSDDFTTGLICVWMEVHRVLKNNGIFGFTFHHNEPSAWAALGESLRQAGFLITAAPFVRSEGKSGFHSSEGNIRYDTILICRKGQPTLPAPEIWSTAIPDILERAKRWLERTTALDLPINAGDVLTALMGEGLVTLLSEREPTENPITINRAIAILAESAPDLERRVKMGPNVFQPRLFVERKARYASEGQENNTEKSRSRRRKTTSAEKY